MLHQYTSQEVANTLWALATLEHHPGTAFLDAAAVQIARRMEQFTPQVCLLFTAPNYPLSQLQILTTSSIDAGRGQLHLGVRQAVPLPLQGVAARHRAAPAAPLAAVPGGGGRERAGGPRHPRGLHAASLAAAAGQAGQRAGVQFRRRRAAQAVPRAPPRRCCQCVLNPKPNNVRSSSLRDGGADFFCGVQWRIPASRRCSPASRSSS